MWKSVEKRIPRALWARETDETDERDEERLIDVRKNRSNPVAFVN